MKEKVVMNNRFFIPAFSCLVTLFCSCDKSNSSKVVTKAEPVVHLAHLSNDWYPQRAGVLSKELDDYFEQARLLFPLKTDSGSVKALIVPHAGFKFSGLCAASAYQTLLTPLNPENYSKNKNIKRVVLMCPSHTTFLKGCAVPYYDVYRTVLGDIKIDKDAIKILVDNGVFKGDVRSHDKEHAIEIQLPFLQKTIDQFTLIPLVVGHTTDEDIGQIVDGLIKIIDDETLVVVSTDFVHHGARFDYDVFDNFVSANIRYFDSLCINALCAQDYYAFEKLLRETSATICGKNPLKILLGLINRRAIDGVNARLSCYYTSAQMEKAKQTKGDLDVNSLFSDLSDRDASDSVSYAGIVFSTQNYSELSPEEILTGYEKKALLSLARRSIENEFLSEKNRLPETLMLPIISYGMLQRSGIFVTLNNKNGDLRGCIGKIETDEPLFQSVSKTALASAFQDSRFSPLTPKELNDVVIDLSILTRPVDISSYKEIILGKHGIILNKNNSTETSSVFLPQVPVSYGWSLEETLEKLSLKANLESDAWQQAGCRLKVFESYEISETDYSLFRAK